jgi:hypothetical protein
MAQTNLSGPLGIIGNGNAITATSAAGAVTLNEPVGIITTESLTTAAGSTYTLTLTNNLILASSLLVVNASSGTNTSAGLDVQEVTCAAGSATINVKNTNASALNGTIVLKYILLQSSNSPSL